MGSASDWETPSHILQAEQCHALCDGDEHQLRRCADASGHNIADETGNGTLERKSFATRDMTHHVDRRLIQVWPPPILPPRRGLGRTWIVACTPLLLR